MTVELLTVTDVARIVGLSEYTVRRAIHAGELRASKLRGRLRVRADDVATWVDESTVQVAGGLLPTAAPRPRAGTVAPLGGYRDRFRRGAA